MDQERPLRSHSYSNLDEVTFTHLNWVIALDFAAQQLKGYAEYTFHHASTATSSVVVLDTHHLSVSKVYADGKETPFALAEKEHPVFGRALVVSVPSHATKIRVDYTTSDASSGLQWLSKELTAGKTHPYLFTQCQAIHARTIVPCPDTPACKFTYSATVTVPDWCTCLMSAIADPQGRKNHNTMDATYQVSFQQSVPIPSYLLAIVAGKLESVDLGPRSRVWAESYGGDESCPRVCADGGVLATRRGDHRPGQKNYLGATVILCHFHVIDYLKREISKNVYAFTAFEKIHAKNLITMMVRTDDEREFDRYMRALQALCKKKNGSGTLSSGDAGEADDDSANIGGITTNIGDFTTNLDELGENSTNPPCISTSGQDVKVGLEKPLQVPLDEEEQNIRETKRASKKLSSLSAKRKLELDETTEEKHPHKILDDDAKSIVKLNTASRSSGRPKQKESFKKAKRSKEITDTLAYVDTVATVGDATLEVLDEVVKTQQLSIAIVGDALDGIRRMFDGAVFKRPKALVIKGNHSRSVESNIRFVLPEPLVMKSIDSATNVKIREELINDTKLASSDSDFDSWRWNV
ncbi:leukotriene A-4 hydrolase, putative [Phytophthora infestans T30-4]|uniref:Leukotriene A-4 hydrolase, putative n=1 Tax=Phytophthora infestans (strain T30-4) TaxID=403677 RepID=D0P3J6_PHYIT|nr:leukotriene A-4 hydrolase, putative [Phytophthora infestans T30-4]EEY60040.1 leukotriene A-4 hydrolase, putative [Phytophthora infestans T30-4]|eukprot:XP_002895130.1 leukotriene A-4 hydrolase, putative [Phytophthora infestans T30-4]